MIDKLIKWCLDNRFVVLAVTLAVVGWGVAVMGKVPVDAIPDIGENQQIIFAEWPGRDAKTVENQVTYPLTTRMFGLPGVKTIRASSAFGFSMVYVVFRDEVDFYWSRSRIVEKLREAQKYLPEGVTPSLGPDATGLGQVFWYTVEGGGLNLQELRSIQDYYIRYQLSSVEGVSEVAAVGGFVKQYQIDIDPDRMVTYGVTPSEVFKAVKNSNVDVGAKVVERGGTEYIVRGVGLIKNTADIENIVVALRGEGVPILVKNIANVAIGPDFRRGVLNRGGQEAAGGVVIVRYGENAREVIKRVKQKISEIAPGLPDGVKIVPFYDRTELIGRTLNTLRDTLILEILATVAVVFLFLWHFASNLIVSLVLPVAIVIAFIFMRMFGIDANIMSLSGIAIAIGALVDAGIVMTENAHRHLSADGGKRPRAEVIHKAAREVGPALLTAVATTVISFIPVFGLTGQEGKLFGPLAYTKTFALVGSAVLAITLVPVLCYYFLKGRLTPPEENPVGKKLAFLYERVLRFMLARRKIFWASSAALVLFAGAIFMKMGREFMPPFDESTILFMPVVSPSVSLTEASRIMRIQNKIISGFPEVDSVVGKAGRAETATDPAPIEMFETIINLKPKKHWRKGMSKRKLLVELDEALKLPGVANIWTQPIINRVDMLSTGIRTSVGVKIFGDDSFEIERLAGKIKDIVAGVPGAADLYAEKITGKPYVEIIPDRLKLARYGIAIGDFMEIVENAIGGENLIEIYEGRERYPARVRFSREYRDAPEKIARLALPLADGAAVRISQIAEVRIIEGPAMINSENGRLRGYVLMNVKGRDSVGFVEEARRKVASELAGQIPPGYSIEWAGQFENQVRARRSITVLLPVSLFLSYLLIFMNFKSHPKSLAIFAAVPVSFAGGVFLLAVSGYNFSVAVWVGFIALFGIAVDDGVLMTTYLDDVFARRNPSDKNSITEAVVEAGKARIRPAFMTSITTILALLPIFIFPGTGKEVMIPMAIPSFAGMIFASLSWFIVPTIYSWIKERNVKN
ncbi:MAG: CusA/CzcA family heavy metal efflux RND transporter [Elusimicrobia bacterium HGW-Elusimicrobia-1]|jgi:Cu(I)/Ag(I) efflux system membrane protein CusA/SilA|nr:MAG: CusA/CzcA family heavy metal efflux RND transporter [Elusimicrobia bacterium HGW-Elusimicrobia-1]